MQVKWARSLKELKQNLDVKLNQDQHRKKNTDGLHCSHFWYQTEEPPGLRYRHYVLTNFLQRKRLDKVLVTSKLDLQDILALLSVSVQNVYGHIFYHIDNKYYKYYQVRIKRFTPHPHTQLSCSEHFYKSSDDSTPIIMKQFSIKIIIKCITQCHCRTKMFLMFKLLY